MNQPIKQSTMHNRTEPLVSVVTVVYNGDEFIEESILSVVSQTYRNIEYIIIDGGSTDETVEIIRKYSEYISFWSSEKDKGMYDALNKGFSKASGDIFAYINSDDLYKSPHVVERIVTQFTQSNSSLVFGDVELINKSGSSLNIYKSLHLPRLMIKCLSRVPFAQQSAFWTRNAFEEIGGFDSSLKYVADSKFFFLLCFNKNYQYSKVNFIVAKFRLHDEAFSTKKKGEMKSEALNMKKMIGINTGDNFRRVAVEIIMKTYNFKALWTSFFGKK